MPFAEPRAYHIMTKPIGPICNLDCEYCFYLEKEQLYDKKGAKQHSDGADEDPDAALMKQAESPSWRMSDETLEAYIKSYIESQDVPTISFAWQGGEPTLMGVDFFRRVVELQQQYCPDGREIENAFQTNGTLLNDEWCAFLKEHNFLIGLSIDGPPDLHDHYRVDKGGKPSSERVLRGLSYLKKHGVEFNTLTVVNRRNSKEPELVYRYLRDIGSTFMQFIPLVEREGDEHADLDLAEPPPDSEGSEPVTPWSVDNREWGRFLCGVFDEWVRHDVGKVFVQLFETQLGILAGMPASLCVFSKHCGKGLALEHNGDLYSCDHYVYPQYKLGNINDTDAWDMVSSEFQKKFGTDKFDELPSMCRKCDYLVQCYGECPKHRFLTTPDGEPGLNYLCQGYMQFFKHSNPYFNTILQITRQGRQAAEIMEIIRQKERPQAAPVEIPKYEKVGRNDPCPCGSGKKFKKCHGR